MKNRAKTYRQFINEAHIDSSGELQDFNPSFDGNYDLELIEEGHRIGDFLESLGATNIRLDVDDPYIDIKFNYGKYHDRNGESYSYDYIARIDLENEAIEISGDTSWSGTLEDFENLTGAYGLDFLNR